MATTKLTGRQLNFQGAAAFTGSSGAANGIIFDNGSGLVLSASRVYLQANPADSLEAATKAYVDSVAGGGVTANQIAFGNGDGSGVSSDAGLVYNPNTDQVGVSGSIHFSGSAASPNFIYGSSTDGLRLSGSKVDVTSAAALNLASAAFDINASGVVGIDSDAAMTLGAASMDIDADGGAIDIDATGAVSIDSSAASMTVGAILADGQTLKLGKNAATEMIFTPHGTAGNEKISLTNTAGTAVDAIAVAASAGGLSLTAKNAASKFTVEGAALTLSGSGINIDGENAEVDITTTGAFDVNVGSVDLDSTAGIALTSTTFDVDASGALTIDSDSTISIDAADDLNLTVTSSGAGEDLTISQIGGNDSSILITAAGTGTDAVSIDATAGSMVIAPSLANAKSLTIGPASATQMVFSPHGTPASELISLTNTAGTAVSDSAAAVQVTATAGAVTLNAGVANAAAVRLVASNAAGGVDIDSGTAGTAIDSTGGVVIGAASASSFTVASGEDNEDLTIEVTGANDASVLIKSSGTGADAISLTTSAGGMDLTVAGAAAGEDLDIVANSSVNISSSENVADAITLNASAGGIDVTAAGAAGEDIDIVNTAGSVTITSGEDIPDAIKLNITGGSTAGTLLQFGSSTHFSVQSSKVVVHENVSFLLDGAYMVGTGSKAWQVPNYVHNSAVVTSGASATPDYGTVTAGSGIAGAAAAGTNGKALGVSLLTGSLRVLGGNGGGGQSSGLISESLRIYQNGLLLASGAANDYTIAQYNFTSGSGATTKFGFDVKLYTAPVVGDVFQVDVSAFVQG